MLQSRCNSNKLGLFLFNFVDISIFKCKLQTSAIAVHHLHILASNRRHIRAQLEDVEDPLLHLLLIGLAQTESDILEILGIL